MYLSNFRTFNMCDIKKKIGANDGQIKLTVHDV